MNEEYDLQLLGKIGVNNTYVIGVTQEVVDTYHPETISDLVPIAGELRFCAEQDFFTDAGNMKFGPMVETYGLNFQVANPVDIMMKYTPDRAGRLRCDGGLRHRRPEQTGQSDSSGR